MNPWNARDTFDVVTKLQQTAVDNPMAWLNASNAKYINVRIDMRTGDFVLTDSFDKVLTQEDIDAILNNQRKIME